MTDAAIDATSANDPIEIGEAQLDGATSAGMLLPAVQSAGDYATPPKKHKVWPWHFW